MLLTTVLVREFWVAYPIFFLTMVLVAMRISPFSAMLTALVEDHRRGALMSLTVALGQVGFAMGGALAGPLFAGAGYWTNTVLGAFSVLGMGLIVWFLLPEPVVGGGVVLEPLPGAAGAAPLRAPDRGHG
jgi:predicted MFS family arabinose efflux permease